MFFFKVATFFLVALAVGAEKKIELQDIEEDNLRSELNSELAKDHEKPDGEKNSVAEAGLGYNSLDFMKTGLLSFFDNTHTQPLHQQQRYVHQYAVTEQPERFAPVGNRPSTQQAMVGYLSNMPMQIYLVPQYTQPAPPQTYSPLSEFNSNVRQSAKTANNNANAPSLRGSNKFVEPAGQPITYVYQPQPTATSSLASVQPLLGFHLPLFNNNIPRLIPSSDAAQSYFSNTDYRDTNAIDETTSQTEIAYDLPTEKEFPRRYNSRAPIRGQYSSHGSAVPVLPHPNPLLLKAPPAQLAHLPRTLPRYRPYTKQVYQEGEIASSSLAPRLFGVHGAFKRRPTSLLDSYIPSSVQIEYLKRGLAKDPSSLYDALSSGRLSHTIPPHLERGFLPNQMYPTAHGGITYGHYKRNPKVEKFPYK